MRWEPIEPVSLLRIGRLVPYPSFLPTRSESWNTFSHAQNAALRARALRNCWPPGPVPVPVEWRDSGQYRIGPQGKPIDRNLPRRPPSDHRSAARIVLLLQTLFLASRLVPPLMENPG